MKDNLRTFQIQSDEQCLLVLNCCCSLPEVQIFKSVLEYTEATTHKAIILTQDLSANVYCRKHLFKLFLTNHKRFFAKQKQNRITSWTIRKPSGVINIKMKVIWIIFHSSWFFFVKLMQISYRICSRYENENKDIK